MRALTSAKVVAAAKRLLERRFGGAYELSELESLSGSGAATVIRARITGSPTVSTRSIVIKYVPPTGDTFGDAALLREIVAYQFTTTLPEAVRPGPALLAYGVADRLIILSDVGDGATLAELLDKANGEQRLKLLRRLGRALGTMHAGTSERAQDFTILMKRMLRTHPEFTSLDAARMKALAASIEKGTELLRRVDVDVPEHVVKLGDEARRRLLSGQHRAFTPFDLTPDNIIVADRLHFLGYEWAGFRDITFDIAGVIAGFPQSLGFSPLNSMEADVLSEAWAHEIAPIWPRVKDRAHMHERILAAMVVWAMFSVVITQHRTMYNLVAAAETDKSPLRDESVPLIIRPGTGHSSTPGKRGTRSGTFTAEERLARHDLSDTFGALATYSQRVDPQLGEPVREFAERVVAQLR